VTEELVEGPPSRRANATLTACPSGNHLWCIGGEFFSEDGKAVRLRLRVPRTVIQANFTSVLCRFGVDIVVHVHDHSPLTVNSTTMYFVTLQRRSFELYKL